MNKTGRDIEEIEADHEPVEQIMASLFDIAFMGYVPWTCKSWMRTGSGQGTTSS